MVLLLLPPLLMHRQGVPPMNVVIAVALAMFALCWPRPSCPFLHDRDAAKLLPEPYLTAEIITDKYIDRVRLC